MLNHFFKRAFDISFSLIGLVVLSPVLIYCIWQVKRFDGGPGLFKQSRVGQNGRLFKIWKIRTMSIDAGTNGPQVTASQDQRITPPGQWLRKYKLDELPQLFNVLFGEMSFVGPRPEVPKYVEHYSDSQKELLNFKPGITDPSSLIFSREGEILAAQNDPEKYYIKVLMPQKVEMSLIYMKSANVLKDFVVILKTIIRIVGKDEKNYISSPS